MFKLILSTLILFIVLALEPKSSHAQCNCSAEGDVKNAYNEAAVVFIGSVQKISPSNYKQGYNEILFKILHIFKGIDELRNQEVVIYTPSNESECSYSFYQSFEYVVYATGKPIFYTTTSCKRNVILEKAYDEMIKLKQLSK
ncbi:MAG: hypothetical protein IT292_11220 [Deltaproteobacteria bacterium]|nr:hypothetical protein [Deltaproteobacteria bacterium]